MAELLDGGVSRVVLGTVALEDPGLVAALADGHPGRVAVGIDYRRTRDGRTEVAVRGWEQGSGRTRAPTCSPSSPGAALAAVVVTAIDRDGTLAGPDLEGLRRGARLATTIPVIASGGVGSAADIEALAAAVGGRPATPSAARRRRLAGAITGKALVDGRMTVEEGVAACARSA